MRRGLVCDHIGNHAAREEFTVNIRRVADQPDGSGYLFFFCVFNEGHRLFESIHNHIHKPDGAAAFSAFGIYFDN